MWMARPGLQKKRGGLPGRHITPDIALGTLQNGTIECCSSCWTCLSCPTLPSLHEPTVMIIISFFTFFRQPVL